MKSAEFKRNVLVRIMILERNEFVFLGIFGEVHMYRILHSRFFSLYLEMFEAKNNFLT